MPRGSFAWEGNHMIKGLLIGIAIVVVLGIIALCFELISGIVEKIADWFSKTAFYKWWDTWSILLWPAIVIIALATIIGAIAT
jgi:uncharacterized membrane protein